VLTRLNGLDFYIEVDGGGAPLLLLHGFTGSLRTWDEVRLGLACSANKRLIVVDLIGHGRSAAPADWRRYTLDWAARDLAALLDALKVDTINLLGYSMGGRVALHFAVSAPERIGTLVLESAAPGIQDAVQRQERIRSDEGLAQRILDQGVEAFVEEWERQPLLEPAPHVSADRRSAQHAQRLQNNPLGLANSLRGMGAGQQTPLWSRLGTLRTPVLLIVGERDARYLEIARRMHTLLPRSHLAEVADAGHNVHLDQPRLFVELVTAALEGVMAFGSRAPSP
jgi:2-succinyl-6-hydroxy-2,4-cyclohexadiene-1-carboxylate synthase